MGLRILKENEIGTGILIEMDAGHISPKEERNNIMLKESNETMDHTKPFEFYAKIYILPGVAIDTQVYCVVKRLKTI